MSDPASWAGQGNGRGRALAELEALGADVDARAARVAASAGARLRCARGCSSCCLDGLTVFRVEAERIAEYAGTSLRGAPPGPAGSCAFLGSEGQCRVYPVRPLVCRTQGLPLRWFAEDERGEIEENRDICPLNVEGPALAFLADEEVWLLGPEELRLREIEERWDGGEGRRTSLRALFGELSGG